MRLERPLAVDDETQVFHPRSHGDDFTCHVYAQAGQRNLSPFLIVEPDGFRLCWGDPWAQSMHSVYRAGRCDFADAQRLVRPATPDHDQSVVGVAHHGRARRQLTAEYLVVRDDPQDRSQFRPLRNAAHDWPPFLPFAAGVVYLPVVEVGADQPHDVARNLEFSYSKAVTILLHSMVLNALTMSGDNANATPSRKTMSSVSARMRLTASIVERPFRKPYWLSYQSGICPDMCRSRRAATTLSRSMPISSSRHIGRYVDGEFADRPPLRSRTNLAVLHGRGQTPSLRHFVYRCQILGAMTPIVFLQIRSGIPSGPGATSREDILSVASHSPSSVTSHSVFHSVVWAVSRGRSCAASFCGEKSVSMTLASASVPSPSLPA